MLRILIVSFTLKELYYDGFYAAIQILKNKYEIDFWKTNFDKRIRNFKEYDLLLFKGNCSYNYAKRIGFNKTSKIKTGLIISSIDSPSDYDLKFYDIFFYETNWYYNTNKSIFKNFKHCYHAFGVDTNIMYDYKQENKEYDVISIGTFAAYKRQHLITKYEGKKIIYGNKYGNEKTPIIKNLENKGVIIEEAVSYFELAKVYNNCKLCYIPCAINGGGERAVLEARACGIPVHVEKDNIKLKELCESKIYTHIDYAECIENGIKNLFEIDDTKLKNNWFVALRKNDGQILNFQKYDNIIYKNLKIDNKENTTIFIADPFIIKHKNNNWLFFEFKKQDKGVIGCINLDSSLKDVVTVIEKPYHISYPFIFKEKDKILMIPETHQGRTLDLYECVEFPYNWKLNHTMFSNVNFSDTTIFKYDRLYWLFTTENVKNNKLSIYYSEDLFNRKWTKHPYSGNNGHRCGGNIFIKDDKIYRPAQNCSKGYGYSLVIYEIITLNKTEYFEKITDEILPKWFPNIYGTHT